MKLLRSFMRDTSAATAIEYALIVTFIGVLGLSALPTVAASINTMFGKAKAGID